MRDAAHGITRRSLLKRGAIGATVLAAAPLVAACASGPAAPTDTSARGAGSATPAPPKEATLRAIGLQGHPSWLATKELAKQFQQDSLRITGGTSVTIEFSEFGGPEIIQKINADFEAKRGEYDITYINSAQSFGQWSEGSVVTALNSYMSSAWDFNDFIPIVRQISEKNGKTYGIPIMIENRMLVYRKDVFDADGIAVPRTVDEMIAVARRLTRTPERYGFTARTAAASSMGFDFLGWLYSYGGRIFDERYKATLTTPEAFTAVGKVLEIMKFAAPGANKSYGEITKDLQNGTAMMANDVSIITPLLEDARVSKFVGKFGYDVAPAGPKGPRPMVSGHMLGIPELSRNKETAWKFIEWITAKERSKDWVLLGGAPLREGHFTNPEILAKYPQYTLIRKILGEANPDYVPRIRPSLEVYASISRELSAAHAGQKSGEDALRAANTQVDEILKRGGYQK